MNFGFGIFGTAVLIVSLGLRDPIFKLAHSHPAITDGVKDGRYHPCDAHDGKAAPIPQACGTGCARPLVDRSDGDVGRRAPDRNHIRFHAICHTPGCPPSPVSETIWR